MFIIDQIKNKLNQKIMIVLDLFNAEYGYTYQYRFLLKNYIHPKYFNWSVIINIFDFWINFITKINNLNWYNFTVTFQGCEYN